MASLRGGSCWASTMVQSHGPSTWCRQGLRLKGKERRSGVLTCQSCTLRRDVAIKLISQPEVALLFRMHNPNIITNARPPLPSTCPAPFSCLISRCWSSHPDKRPHFDEIVHILEGYAESLEQDPDFFSSYKPPQNHALL